MAMARTHYLQAIHNGKVALILLMILTVMFMIDYHSEISGTSTVAKVTHQGYQVIEEGGRSTFELQ